MPADRLLHRRAGRGVRTSSLTDLEYRVWTQYLLSADDFGVMPMKAVALQSDNDHLAGRPAKTVLRCLETLVRTDLVRSFEHQGKTYLYQWDWQDWQRVRWPAKTINPPPPGEHLSEASKLLVSVYPGGVRVPQKIPDSTPEVPEKNSGGTSRSHSHREVAVSREEVASAAAPPRPAATLTHRRRKDAAWEGPRFYVPQRTHDDFLGYRGGNEGELLAWYAEVEAGYVGDVDPNMFRFWEARYREKWPPSAPAKVDRRPEWLRRAQERKAAQS